MKELRYLLLLIDSILEVDQYGNMPDKRTPLVNGEYYHIFNRGVARQPTFLSKTHYKQAMFALKYYRFRKPPLRLSRLKDLSISRLEEVLSSLSLEADIQVKIVSFVLMPNHFHFLLQQISDKGISTFISKLTNSYTKYFNTKHRRVGPVFQGLFKAVHIESTQQLLHVSRYIHLNPFVSSVVSARELSSYPYSSFPEFLRGESSFISLDPILINFPSPEKYKSFVFDQADYGRRLEEIKHLTLEE